MSGLWYIDMRVFDRARNLVKHPNSTKTIRKRLTDPFGNYYLKTKKLPEHKIQHTSTEETFPGKNNKQTINPKKQKVNQY